MVFVAYTTSPFVNEVYIRLPFFARRSRDQLMRWSQNIAPDTEMGIKTMRFYGRQHVTRMLLKDLKPMNARLGVVNVERVVKDDVQNQQRAWWMGRKPHLFYIGEDKANGRGPASTVLQKVMEQIRKSSDVN